MTGQKGADPAPDMRDPVVMAVKVTAIEGQMALLAQQVSTGMANVSSQLSALQGDMRDQGKVLKAVETSQHDMQSHSEGLSRLAAAIDRNSNEFAAWRKDHELENKQVADKVTTFRGALIGFGLVAFLLTSIVVYTVRDWFNQSAAERQRIERASDVSDARLESKQLSDQHDNDARLDALEAKR